MIAQEAYFKIIKLEDFFKIQLKVFKLIGLNIFPLEIKSIRDKIIDKLMRWYFHTCLIGFVLLIIQFSVQLVIDIEKFDVVVNILPNIILFPYNCSKGLFFFIHRKRILKIIEKLRVSFPSTQADQQSSNLENHLKFFAMIYKIYILFYYVDISSAMSGTLHLLIFKNIRRIPVYIWFPFEYTANNRIFIHTLFWGAWTIGNACVNVIAADFFIFAIVFVLALEFKILSENIKNTINAKEVTKLRELLVQHQELIEINESIKSLFRFIFFYTFIQGAVSISSCGFLLLTAPNIADLIYSISFTACSLSQVFLYCYFGEKLISASQDIGNNILDSKWYDLEDIGMKKSIILIIMRSQKACVLSGFGFVTLTIETFSNVRF